MQPDRRFWDARTPGCQGAGAPTSRLKNPQVDRANHEGDAAPIKTPADRERRGWIRTPTEIAEWLIEGVGSTAPVIVGIDHAFSLPHSYFRRYELTGWQRFLDEFVEHWPTDEPHTHVDFVPDQGSQRTGARNDLRLTERRGRSKSSSMWTLESKNPFVIPDAFTCQIDGATEPVSFEYEASLSDDDGLGSPVIIVRFDCVP